MIFVHFTSWKTICFKSVLSLNTLKICISTLSNTKLLENFLWLLSSFPYLIYMKFADPLHSPRITLLGYHCSWSLIGTQGIFIFKLGIPFCFSCFLSFVLMVPIIWDSKIYICSPTTHHYKFMFGFDPGPRLVRN